MNGEKGQALPLAMLALTIGALIIAPFLGHASASIIGSRTYAEAIALRNSCDAGVEHAIWSLTRGTLAAQLPNPGDHITYQLGETLNGVNTTVTVTTNASGGGGAVGDITNTVISTLEYDTVDGWEPDIIQISSSVYAIAYRGVQSDGWLKTVTIATNGTISPTVISTLEFDTADGWEPNIIPVSGNVYAIAYRGVLSDGWLKTVTIATNGTISPAIISTLEFDTSDGATPTIIPISGNVYAIVYTGTTNNGFLKTITIATNGTISPTIIATLAFGSSLYAPYIINVGSNIYVVVGRGNNNNGVLRTIEIAAGGGITNPNISSFIFDNGYGYEPVMAHVSEDIFAIAYRGTSDDGFVITVGIKTSAAGVASYRIVSTAGGTTISALVNTDNTTASIVSWQIQ